MMKGKIIVIEGTDCSGKQTQTEILKKRLLDEGYNVATFSFPNYNSPTGKIIGGPYLGKSYICDGWFEEGAGNVNPKVAALYYAADRLYNIDTIMEKYNQGYIVILDRYVYSNIAHQGGRIEDDIKRFEMYKWLDKLEFDLIGLPKADIGIFLHVPYKVANELKKNREEEPDQLERDEKYLINGEKAYFEMASLYNFSVIECSLNDKILPIDDISDKIYNIIKKEFE